MNPDTNKLLEALHHRIHAKPVTLRTMHLAETAGDDLVAALPGIPPEVVGEVALHVAASRAAVLYGLDADASLVARAADRALEGSGIHVWYDSDDDTVWIAGRNRAIGDATRFEPGQQLVVGTYGTWRVEDAVDRTVA